MSERKRFIRFVSKGLKRDTEQLISESTFIRERHDEVPHKVCNSYGTSPSRRCLFSCFRAWVAVSSMPGTTLDFSVCRQTVIDMLHSSDFHTGHYVYTWNSSLQPYVRHCTALHCTALHYRVLCFTVNELRKIKLYCEVRENTNEMQQLDVYYQHFLNMFRASLWPSSGEQDVC